MPLEGRQRQAVRPENRCRVIQAIGGTVGVLQRGTGRRLIRLPYLEGKIRGVFARGKGKPFVLVGCMESFAGVGRVGGHFV